MHIRSMSEKMASGFQGGSSSMLKWIDSFRVRTLTIALITAVISDS